MRLLKIAGAVLGAGAVVVGLFGIWVWIQSNALLSAEFKVPQTRIEHPWPFTDADVAELRLADPDFETTVDLNDLRKQRAIQRGATLAKRLRCLECHGEDLGGRVVMDVAPVMGILAPNLTLGEGGLPGEYSLNDFERIVRHGVKRDGTAALMPAVGTAWLSNQEVSDLYAFVLSKPHVNRQIGPSYWGPVMRTMAALGRTPPPDAHQIDHRRRRLQSPPSARVPKDLGSHLARTCAGCHGAKMKGGPIPGGNPDWPDASDLTALDGWSEGDFVTVMRTGKRPDGTEVDGAVMPWEAMGTHSDAELAALWTYLGAL